MKAKATGGDASRDAKRRLYGRRRGRKLRAGHQP